MYCWRCTAPTISSVIAPKRRIIFRVILRSPCLERCVVYLPFSMPRAGGSSPAYGLLMTARGRIRRASVNDEYVAARVMRDGLAHALAEQPAEHVVVPRPNDDQVRVALARELND